MKSEHKDGFEISILKMMGFFLIQSEASSRIFRFKREH